MDFSLSPLAQQYLDSVRAFMSDRVYPAERRYAEEREELTAAGRPHEMPPVLAELVEDARSRGLWNLFLNENVGLTTVEYAVLAEETGRSPYIAPAAMNCLSPDTGNIELLRLFASSDQKSRWLEPLLDGSIRSGYAMTEPDVASSDATNISLRIERDGDDLLLNGRKWWTTGGGDPRCKVLIVMGKSDASARPHRQHSIVLVPIETPGVNVIRTLKVFGYLDQQGHAEIVFENVRVPAASLLGEEGAGFAMAQARLGPGRVHHCMRAIGMAERALELACRRVLDRTAFGGPLADQGVIQAQIAESRMEIDQARLLVLRAGWLIDNVGVKAARAEIAAIKVIAPRVALAVLDRAIQIHGGAGVTDDLPLAWIWARARTLRIADGPDEVHIRTVGRQELRKYA